MFLEHFDHHKKKVISHCILIGGGNFGDTIWVIRSFSPFLPKIKPGWLNFHI